MVGNVQLSPHFDLNFSICHRWLAWSCDAIDFFSVSLTITNLEKQFNRSTHDIVSYVSPVVSFHFLSFSSGQTTSITLTLLFRSIGAVSTASVFSLSPPPLTYPCYRLFLASSLIGLVESGH